MSVGEETPRHPLLFCHLRHIRTASRTVQNKGPPFQKLHEVRLSISVFLVVGDVHGEAQMEGKNVMYSIPAFLLPLTLKSLNKWRR